MYLPLLGDAKFGGNLLLTNINIEPMCTTYRINFPRTYQQLGVPKCFREFKNYTFVDRNFHELINLFFPLRLSLSQKVVGGRLLSPRD